MDREAVAKELIYKRELDIFCDLLNKNSVPFLVWKGAALAYEIYEDPLERARLDADILISPVHKQNVFQLLTSAGYILHPNQHEILGQASFIKHINQLSVIYDVHWEVFAQQSLKSLFNFEELWMERKKLSQSPACTVCDEMALVLSCLHWVAHHYAHPEPRWIDDIQRLTAHRPLVWWQKVKSLGDKKNIRQILHATLKSAQVPSPWTEKDLVQEPLQYLLHPERTLWSDFRNDWKAMGFQRRWSVLIHHLFPSAEHMRMKYQLTSQRGLYFYYFYRIFNGLTKTLNRE